MPAVASGIASTTLHSDPVPPPFHMAASVVRHAAPLSTQPLQSTPELLDELKRMSDALETATPREVLRQAVDRFAPKFTMATAFGPEGMVIIHMLAELQRDDLHDAGWKRSARASAR